jgi:SecD/SecF fusion protein
MVLIDAAFTLPGLAGLVLTLGMAVDANILIYERIREERKRGVDIKRAISNGYDRALPTIIDTHLCSIFTAVVLYIVGNDQLKGFGISLTVGLIISFFTSLYLTRLIFDIWQDRGWLTKLRMPFDPLSGFNINFMSMRWVFMTVTVVLTIAGGALFVSRLDHGGLNIDFVKGTAYSGQLVNAVEISDLRKALEKANLPDLSIEQMFINDPEFRDPNNSRASKLFTVRTTETDVKKVTDEINKAIGSGDGNVQLKKVAISDRIEYLPGADKVKSLVLGFVKPENTDQSVFASRAQISFQVGETLRRMTEEREAKLKDPATGDEERTRLQNEIKVLQLLPQSYSVVGLGQEKEGNFQFVELQFLDTLKPEELALVKSAMDQVKEAFAANPLPERLENFDPQLAQETRTRALYAIVASWGAILLYLWFRFGSWTFGLAAVLCLVHDLFFALGAVAVCHYIYDNPIGQFLQLGDFKIDLPSVAALLTLVGYSVNDTIVVFDRIREVRGKNPALTEQMINESVNQTLSRTILASFTTFLVVFVLYWVGGEGVHLFAFVMVVGIIVGTYSSIYVAAPLLLILGEGNQNKATAPAPKESPAPQTTGAPA